MPFACGAGISVNDVYLNENIKIDADMNGLITDTNNYCQILFYEAESGYLADRASDEYPSDNNHIISVDYMVNEPPFFRDNNYNVEIVCGNAKITKEFAVNNKRSIAFTAQKETEYLIKGGNIDFIFILFTFGSVLILFLIAIIIILKRR